MKEPRDSSLTDYYAAAESWSADKAAATQRSARLAWTAAAVMAAIAVMEAAALVVLLPLKSVQPYTLLVDRQTGFVQELKPLERQQIAPDTALVRSFLVQYVIAREGFDIGTLKTDYRKVALWSAGEARSNYLSMMQASNPLSPLATLPRSATVAVEVRSVSSLNADTVLVRFATVRQDPGGQPAPAQAWASVLKYRFSGGAMSAEDRLINPLGFQVTRYRRDAEMLSEQVPRSAISGNGISTTPAVARDSSPGQSSIPGQSGATGR